MHLYIERDLFKELAHDYKGWQVQNLQGRLTGWRPREGLMLQFQSESRMLAELCLSWEISVFFLARPSTD